VSRPLRIAVAEFAARGGLLHYASQMADALARRGHEVTLLTPPGVEAAGRPTEAHHAPVLSGFDPATPRAASLPARVLQRAGRGALQARAWADLALWLRRNPVDLVQLGDLRLMLDALGLVALSAVPGSPPLVDVCHNVRPFDTRLRGRDVVRSGPLMERALRRAYARCALVAVHGEANAAEFRRHWRVATPTLVIPHGDERIFGPPPEPAGGPPTVLFFGNWSRYKDLHLLLDAFAIVAERMPAARLEIVGHPTKDVDSDAVVRRAREIGDAVRVFAGYASVDEARAAFARACVVALPYRHGFQSGVTSLAFSLARPVVCTRVGGLPEAVEASGGGEVVPASDARAFADALTRALADPAASLERGARAHRWQMEDAGWEAVAAILEEGYRGVAGVPG
jgi:glycosyltransferase involved in cell wall biosynthesis